MEINNKKITPINSGVIIKRYSTNPYMEKLFLDDGLILPDTSTYQSNESGQEENNQLLIACAKVISVGQECKIVRPGDDVYYYTMVANPIPFGNKGYLCTNEQNIYCIINDK